MNMQSDISVIIPVYNGATYLGEAIESVLAQTLAPAEIIVVDDGSTDGSAAVADRYAPSVRVIRQPNAGCGAARNTGVRHARGAYLAFLDADDLWTPDKLQQQAAARVADPGLDMIFGRVEIIDARTDNASSELYEGIHAGTMLITRAAFERVGAFSSQRIVEFADWYARATECGLRSRSLPTVLMKRRLHEGNVTRSAEYSREAYLDVLRAALQRRKGSGASSV
jgi:glycosyltransferase involved in cell wall biosynthesis